MARFALTAVLATLFLALVFAAFPTSGFATDVDGPDCQRSIEDWGDAPEGIAAYPLAAPLVIGAFPTCGVAGPVGTQNISGLCVPLSTPPGPTGFVRHRQFGTMNYWLGCYGVAAGALGIDGEPDGKTNTPAVGFSACMVPGIPTDCMEPLEGTFDQDECYGDGSDATLSQKVVFKICSNNTFNYDVYSCLPGATFVVFLNILVDWNQDGDWNDNFDTCPSPNTCVYEWAVKNRPVVIGPGCNLLTTPVIVGGPFVKKNVWMRISISNQAVKDDFPWAGSVTPTPGIDSLDGGETEDYLVDVATPVPTVPETWGSIKAMYR